MEAWAKVCLSLLLQPPAPFRSLDSNLFLRCACVSAVQSSFMSTGIPSLDLGVALNAYVWDLLLSTAFVF